MEDTRYTITFTTSPDEESKKAGEGVTTTTTIDFVGWTDEDFKAAAAETVKIRQIQPRLRKGLPIGTTFVASRPGHKGTVDPAEALLARFGSIEGVVEELKRRMAARA